jgi:hypothetical protein
MMTDIGSLYYKGISQSQVQDDVRSITDEVTQHLQLTDSAPTSHISASAGDYCIGTTRYSYVLGRQINSSPVSPQHVLWRDTVTAGTCPVSPNLSSANLATTDPTGTELISLRSRLTNFSISATSPYTITVDIAFGDDDQLCDTGIPNSCDSSTTTTIVYPLPAGHEVLCKGSKAVSAQQFCGTADLTTTAVQRLQ